MKVYFLIVYYIHAVQNIALEHRGKSQMFLNLILLGMLKDTILSDSKTLRRSRDNLFHFTICQFSSFHPWNFRRTKCRAFQMWQKL